MLFRFRFAARRLLTNGQRTTDRANRMELSEPGGASPERHGTPFCTPGLRWSVHGPHTRATVADVAARARLSSVEVGSELSQCHPVTGQPRPGVARVPVGYNYFLDHTCETRHACSHHTDSMVYKYRRCHISHDTDSHHAKSIYDRSQIPEGVSRASPPIPSFCTRFASGFCKSELPSEARHALLQASRRHVLGGLYACVPHVRMRAPTHIQDGRFITKAEADTTHMLPRPANRHGLQEPPLRSRSACPLPTRACS